MSFGLRSPIRSRMAFATRSASAYIRSGSRRASQMRMPSGASVWMVMLPAAGSRATM
jgi:hypothetical protein